MWERYSGLVLLITYALREDTVDITFCVHNSGQNTMPFGIGGHPGFNVPLVGGEQFEDYVLEFSCPCQPDRVGFSPAVYLNGQDELYALREDKYIDLRHDLFDEDAVILKNMAREITLRSKVSGRGVCVVYPDLAYLGIWHWPKTTAPYVCIEPWSSLPSRQNVIEELTCKSDLIQFVTCGADGCWFQNKNACGHVYGLSNLCVTDTTGAGDIFGGAAVAQVLQISKAPEDLVADELSSIVKFACAAAGLSTTKPGGISSVPPIDQVREILEGMT